MMFVAACGVGSDSDNPPSADAQVFEPNPLAIQCTDAFKISGTFTPSTARPVDVAGCWPAGTWTFSLTRDPSNDAILDINGDKMPDRCGAVAGTSPATFKPSYSFTATTTTTVPGEYDTTFMFATGQGIAANCMQAGDCLFKLSVSQDGARECEGAVDVYSADRKQNWNLHPTQETGSTTLEGTAEYTLYLQAQQP